MQLTAVGVRGGGELASVVNGNSDSVRLEDTSRVSPSNYHGEHLVGTVFTLLVVEDGDGDTVPLVTR